MENASVNKSIEYSIDLTRQKIIFVGDSGVGKTSIITRINENTFEDLKKSSIGIDYYSKKIKYKEDYIKLQIWDTAGQEKYRGLIPSYVRNSSLVFLIYDITSKKSFENLQNWIEFIQSIEKTKIVICGNKIDLDERQVSKEEGENFAKKKGLIFFEVSAKTNVNIENMLYHAITELPYFEENVNNEHINIIDKNKLFQELAEENEIKIENNEPNKEDKNDIINNKLNNKNNTGLDNKTRIEKVINNGFYNENIKENSRYSDNYECSSSVNPTTRTMSKKFEIKQNKRRKCC